MNLNEEPLILRREFGHQVQYVFNAFASAEAISQWFAPHDSIETKVTRYEFVEGGAYRMEFTLPDGISTSLAGNFHSIREPDQLVFSFCWEKPDPHADIDTLVTVDLLAKGGNTEIIISHIKLSDEPMKKRHKEGWLGTLSRLEIYLDKTEI